MTDNFQIVGIIFCLLLVIGVSYGLGNWHGYERGFEHGRVQINNTSKIDTVDRPFEKYEISYLSSGDAIKSWASLSSEDIQLLAHYSEYENGREQALAWLNDFKWCWRCQKWHKKEDFVEKEITYNEVREVCKYMSKQRSHND